MRNKKAKAFWIGITAFYVVAVSTVIALDVSLHWGLIAGVKILVLVHILVFASIVSDLGRKRK
jgi:hypothetical protein